MGLRLELDKDVLGSRAIEAPTSTRRSNLLQKYVDRARKYKETRFGTDRAAAEATVDITVNHDRMSGIDGRDGLCRMSYGALNRSVRSC
jgi:hypothetical protein